MEMIDLTGKFEGELAKIEKKGMEKGILKGKRSIIARLLENHSLEEVSKILDIEKTTLISILQK
ncbi:hypothetical protein [Methanobrevibacter sp.]